MSDREALPDAQLDDVSVKIGDLVDGKYRIERVLGRGGMGVVVAATHIHLLQRVALKFLLGVDTGGAWGERFLREARAAARLKNGHVAKVIDVGTLETGSPYIVMEYLEGRSLGEIVREHRALDLREVVDFVLQVCEGLAEAHAIGIVHRDLKPDNLFLTQRADGHPLVKILDFGISKTIDPAVADAVLTRTHDVVGSPLYMSPEQLRSARAADFRSDVWSLGVILYELSTGKVPFTGESYPELILRVVDTAPPPPRSLRPELPVGFEAVILKCIEKSPAARYANVADLASALAPFAPEAMQDMPARVTTLLAGGSSPGALANSNSASQAASGGRVHTDASWAATRRVLRSPLGTALGVAAALVLVGGALALGVGRSSQATVTSTAPPVTFASPALGRDPAAPPTGATPDPPSAAPSPEPSASAARAEPKGTAARRPVGAGPSAIPKASASVLPARDGGDLVFERK